MLFVVLLFVCSTALRDFKLEVDKTQYEAGKTQFELLQTQSQMPEYGKCWTSTVVSLQEGCKHLTDFTQSRLALAYLNCFLQVQGREPYPCDESMRVRECMLDITESDRSSLATFFTHTQNICYFLQSQVWHENTQATITRLSQTSSEVAENLAATTELQREALHNQEIIIQQSVNLSHVINSSSENLHAVISDFRKTTDEQRLLINDIFDKIASLQRTMLGEFSGFYSIVYYTMSVLLSYLVTSTPRTGSARFWMFGIVTANILVERLIIYVCTSGLLVVNNSEEAAYSWHIFCRKVSGVIAVVVLVIHAVRYRDLNALNNQLLLDIKAELCHLRGKDQALPLDEIDHMSPADSDPLQIIRRVAQSQASALAEGTDESDSAWSSSSDLSDLEESSSQYTDVSYRPNHRATEMGDNSSTASMSHTESSSIDKEELEFLRNSTPLRDGKLQRMQTWSQTGYYVNNTRDGSSPVSPSSPGSSTPKYNLRQRTLTQIMNPALKEESPKTFQRQVRNLERLAMKNSSTLREKLKRVIADSQYRIEEKN